MGKLMKLKKLNSKGLTLVEILAALALLSLIITLAMTIFISGKNAVDRQNFKANMQDSVTLAMKDITKQVRSVGLDEMNFDNNKIVIGDHTYRNSDNKIFKDNLLLADDIAVLKIEEQGNIISISIESTDSEISLFSEILIRE